VYFGPKASLDSIISVCSRLQCCNTVRNLGIYVDSDPHLEDTVWVLRYSMSNLQSLLCHQAGAKVTYDISLSHQTRLWLHYTGGLPTRQLDRLQSAFNAAARIIYSLKKRTCVLLHDLHWLRVPHQVSFCSSCLQLPVWHRRNGLLILAIVISSTCVVIVAVRSKDKSCQQ